MFKNMVMRHSVHRVWRFKMNHPVLRVKEQKLNNAFPRERFGNSATAPWENITDCSWMLGLFGWQILGRKIVPLY